MSSPVLPSTFLLTLLLFVGLFFFIRASAKDRTQIVKLVSEQPEPELLSQLKQYFAQRAYQVIQVNAEQNQVILEGFVRPSLFLAVFLTLLATLGILCLVLVLSMLTSEFSLVYLGLLFLSPIAGLFYWRKAGRAEQVTFRLQTATDTNQPQSLIQVTAHRDEIIELQRSLQLHLVE